jgi:NADPH-dependent 2,4-dienoyl-CoA reductase/sulfur reductase-like enzyme
MAAAIEAAGRGLSVVVADDQPAPGGQIWRSVEASTANDAVLGDTYVEGREVAKQFRASGAEMLDCTQVWQIEPGFRVYMTSAGRAHVVEAGAVLLATGAQERPTPFPGWTLPGVLTVGAAQILLKSSSQIPQGPTWIAGTGPLPLLYAVQFLQAGGTLGGYLDTAPVGQWRTAIRHLPRALGSMGDLIKGLRWAAVLKSARVPVMSGVHGLRAVGEERLQEVCFLDRKGQEHMVEVENLLVHEGVVPSVHMPMALGCEMRWSAAQDCYVPRLDEWGESSVSDLYIAGDGAGIGGAKAALLRGRLAAMRVTAKAISAHSDVSKAEVAIRAELQKELAIRPFLDAMFRPRNEVFEPSDETIVCRCEEVTAGEIRALAHVGTPGPNQVKSALRTGMGPCQGRQCGYTVSRILAAKQQRAIDDVGFFHIRSPLKPVTLQELASVQEDSTE